MFERPPFDQDGSFRAWLSQDAETVPPAALIDRVLERTGSTRRRPAWRVPERWFPMETTARFGAVPRSVMLLIIIGLLVAALAGIAALGAGSRANDTETTAPRGPGAFSAAPSMGLARASHTATLLDDGRILVTGGEGADQSPLAHAELRDPATGTFEATGSMNLARRYHTATLLADGRVLIAGGVEEGIPTAELWEPTTGTFRPIGELTDPRGQHTATLLDDGRVLLVGGGEIDGSAEIWDPTTETFVATGSTAVGRAWHAANLLPDGSVLITGGQRQAERWDPATETFAPAGFLAQARVEHTATLLEDGSVLVIGGMAGQTFGGDAVATAELWDPDTLTFSPAGLLAEPRGGHTATLLPDGRVLVAGGYFIESAEIWDPLIGAFTEAGSMTDPRGGHTAAPIDDGRVVVAGGYQDSDETFAIASTEIWDPFD